MAAASEAKMLDSEARETDIQSIHDGLSPDSSASEAQITNAVGHANGDIELTLTGHQVEKAGAGEQQPPVDKPTHHSWKFYIIFIGLVGAGVLSALDGALVSTALPTIVAELDIGADYVWVANIYFLTR